MSRFSFRPQVELLDHRSVPAVLLSVGDAYVLEGHGGTHNAVITVSVSEPPSRDITVDFATSTVNGFATATAGRDYTAVSGKLTFRPGETSKAILVPIHGDRLGERPEEYFNVQLANAKGARIDRAFGHVFITDDEPQIVMSGVSVAEGQTGSTTLTLTVRLSQAYDREVTIDYATVNQTAFAGEDYEATAGSLTFAPGETTKTFTVQVLGDINPEPDEYFHVQLLGTWAGSGEVSSVGPVSILDDDGYVPPPDNGGWGWVEGPPINP